MQHKAQIGPVNTMPKALVARQSASAGHELILLLRALFFTSYPVIDDTGKPAAFSSTARFSRSWRVAQ